LQNAPLASYNASGFSKTNKAMTKTKTRRMFSMPRVLAVMALAFLVFLSTQDPLGAQAVTQGYGADTVLQRGMLVRLKQDDTTKVEPVTYEVGDKTHGIVVDANDAPVSLSSEGQKVFIATAGKFDVLVSDQNGAIAAGDYLTISSIGGIAMKASEKDPVVVGRALASLMEGAP
jgi:hypothetical protein